MYGVSIFHTVHGGNFDQTVHGRNFGHGPLLHRTLFSYFRGFMVVIMTIIFVMLVLYVKLFFVARKHANAICAMSISGEVISRGHVRKTSDHAWRYTKTVLLIVGVNCAAWLPIGEFKPWSSNRHSGVRHSSNESSMCYPDQAQGIRQPMKSRIV